jgi:hypothetical protein
MTYRPPHTHVAISAEETQFNCRKSADDTTHQPGDVGAGSPAGVQGTHGQRSGCSVRVDVRPMHLPPGCVGLASRVEASRSPRDAPFRRLCHDAIRYRSSAVAAPSWTGSDETQAWERSARSRTCPHSRLGVSATQPDHPLLGTPFGLRVGRRSGSHPGSSETMLRGRHIGFAPETLGVARQPTSGAIATIDGSPRGGPSGPWTTLSLERTVVAGRGSEGLGPDARGSDETHLDAAVCPSPLHRGRCPRRCWTQPESRRTRPHGDRVHAGVLPQPADG